MARVGRRKGKWGKYLVHASVVLIVLIWTIPTLGILVTSLRNKDAIAVSGWWTALTTNEQNFIVQSADPATQVQENGKYLIKGNVLAGSPGSVVAFGTRIMKPKEFKVGETAPLPDGGTLTIAKDGSYQMASDTPFAADAGRRLYYTALKPPTFTLENFKTVLTASGLSQSFINSLTVTVPATIIPILIAAYAAYALSWMRFPGRALLLSIVVGLLVVPLQMSLIPLLRFYNDVGHVFGVPAKTYLGIWLAHTGFGLPLAIYLLRNYIAGLPNEIMESARVDGATDFEIFVRIVLPLSVPALASFAIFQFLWVWNDLLVAIVFLGQQDNQLVLTGRLRALLGSRGGDWEILTTSAFVSIVVPLLVFFSLQRYLVRGLLAGSVKGG